MNGLRVKLERVGQLVGAGGELERDLALELLREIYAEVKFGGSEVAAEDVAEPAVAEPTAEPATEQIEEPAVAEPIDEPVAEQIEETATAEPVEERAIAGPIAEEISEPTPEPASAPEPEPKTEPEQEPEPMSVTSARVVAPDVIRSLYGSGNPATEPKPEPAPQPAAPQPQPQPAQPQPVREPAPTVEQPQSTQPQSAATLGDTIGAGHTTLGESLRSGERDMATRAAAAEKPGLRRSIGLNDRFLMIRDMFGGDAAAFDGAIERLDAFTDLDEAVVWMRGNFDWSADSPGAEMLVGLLERKLGR